MATINRVNKAFFNLTNDWIEGGTAHESGSFKAMLLTSLTVLDADWDSETVMDQYSAMGEYVDSASGYYRVALSGLDATTTDNGTKTYFSCNNITFSSLVAPTTNDPTHLLIYFEPAGGAPTPNAVTDLIPCVIVDCAFTPDGTDFTAVMPSGGLFYVETA